jgi:hypothetical protein
MVTEGVRLVSLPDIGAMKLGAIAGRGKKRDFTDLYFLLKKFTFRPTWFFQPNPNSSFSLKTDPKPPRLGLPDLRYGTGNAPAPLR